MAGKLALVGVFNASGQAGPRRLVAIAGATVVLVGGIIAASSIRSPEPPLGSKPGVLPHVDPLPGGVHSNPHQDALAVITNQEQAKRAEETGTSFTPVMPASSSYGNPPYKPAMPRPTAQARVTPAREPIIETVKPVVASVVPPTPTPAPAVSIAAPAPGPAPASTRTVPSTSPIVRVASQDQRSPDDTATKDAIKAMMATWSGRAPRTDVVMPDPAPGEPGRDDAPGQAGPSSRQGSSSREGEVSNVSRVSTSQSLPSRQETVLVPAGRGIYAHTILAANSDAESPVVLQADSGPISGDRMIGSFTRERDRLVIRISKLIHRGEEIGVDGLAIAPTTMEVGVASSVDQNYLSRFLLPAAAAFVQGLGQAIAQSNQLAVLGPLGSVTTQNQLNFPQQIGIGAGVAAAQIGSTLAQSAPKGPTVTLDVGASVGVMFLTNVSMNGDGEGGTQIGSRSRAVR